MPSPIALRLPARFPWLGISAVLLALGVGAGLWQWQRTSVDAIAQARFERKASAATVALETHVGRYLGLLTGVRGLFIANPHLTRAEFDNALRELRLWPQYAGIVNLAFTRYVLSADRAAFEASVRADASLAADGMPPFAIRPEGDRPDYYIADYVWPRSGNMGVVGLDIGAVPATMESVRYSRDSGSAIASAPYDMLQASEHRSAFSLRLPVFTDGAGGGQRYVGSVAAAIRFHDLVSALREEGRLTGLDLGVQDVGSVRGAPPAGTRTMLELPAAASGAHRYERELQIYDRRWKLTFVSQNNFLSPAEQAVPWLAATGGALATLLLVLLAASWRWRHAALKDPFQTLFDQAAVGVAQVDTATRRFVRANARFCQILGYEPQELLALTVRDVTHQDDQAETEAVIDRLAAGGQQEYRYEKRYRRKDGQMVWAELRLAPMRNDRRQPAQHIAVVQDISDRKQMEAAQRDSEARLRQILYRLPVGVCLVARDGTLSFRNERFEQICRHADAVPSTVREWWEAVQPDALRREQAMADWDAACTVARAGDGTLPSREYAITCGDGSVRTVDMAGVLLDGACLITMVDLSQHKAAEEEIHYLAYYDPLTQLPNRRLLVDRLQQALAASVRRGRCGAVLMLDLDNFKTLNETQGHERGDMLLRQVAQRLRGCVQNEDTVARHGGDEFVVVLEDLGQSPQGAAARAEEMGQKILAAMRHPFMLEGEAHHTTLSMGVTVFQGARETVDELLQRTDLAMYQAKASGRNALRFYDPQMQASVAARAALETDLRDGLGRGEFELFYQPQVHHGHIVGAEALLRWRHPARGFVSPGEFIPLAEETGLILPLGEWVLRAACERLAQWSRHPVLSQISLSVNVSARQFHQGGFVGQVLAALAGTGAEGRRLKLEMTESLLQQDLEDTIQKMQQLRAYGVGFSLDDFGTGYSSLAYLKRLPLDELKIDQSFVRDVLTDPNDASIARTIVALGTSLGLRVIAEGVETEAQRVFLERNHCHAWQGYLLSRPVSADDFEHLVLSFPPKDAAVASPRTE
ncbi:bifunctional diguanylate cyclase/phosphodiesterase [Paracidovorax avenae]|uniref:bifunctional diguanylate cyclase/phosphodiesterase n=1 Tax=Paracidovorax avenae TaxID=80867 RepID=UPI000D15533F|nr:EAL domain-containing protein [Paracidovorax avenae]AVS70743.1 bifunctional diguanylate cyclase/phosphodiesterase [Paracidovorax avenae]AVS78015.1 bifunctional diguanylate cyclase/phosphodiesterase [Paracidovorax avenae]AVS81310.1 bifunctional diguanylate cyclase/phosphodiesterase [Paracidovorax avenae]AVS90907.1 bifunctional diguanylate cyclase/phosphodiesterase [Paracidovorax avenae]AVT16523.1 bifunctional diguanylate cyclase/phosphodiesterase [Paracidovorax avenae]